MPHPLSTLRIDNRFTAELPADPQRDSKQRQVYGACFSWVEPTATASPSLIAVSNEVASLIGLDSHSVHSAEFCQVFSGNRLVDGMQPWACCYGGHQFGHWAGQLGDGRAINLCEVIGSDDQHYTLQLKGAGPTPYSRHADGLAVLRSSIREFLCSEAMHHLGVPTTRALSLCLTGDKVLRDMFYDGRAQLEPGAVVCRVAESFTRFGSFEICASRGDIDLLRQLADYTIKRDFCHLAGLLQRDPQQVYLRWFAEVCESTCALIVHWMRVGFVHGVMNTDNMSIIGQTIDYGPYGWIDNFDLDWTPNTTDAGHKRYRFGNQAAIGQWNLLQLANAIYPLIESSDELEALLHQYQRDFDARWLIMMRNKLGLGRAMAEDREFCHELEQHLHQCQLDMTLFYRLLAEIDARTPPDQLLENFNDAFYNKIATESEHLHALKEWLLEYQARLRADSFTPNQRQQRMAATNPLYVPRNYLAQQAIDRAEAGDYAPLQQLMTCLKQPYREQPGCEAYAAKRPDWALNKAGCSMLSCSS